MDYEEIIEDFSNRIASGELKAYDLMQYGLDYNSIQRIKQLAEHKNYLEYKEKATSRLSSFIHHTKHDYKENWHHTEICESIDDFLFNPENDTEILILQAPPRTGKSEIVSRRLPAYILGRKPDYKVVFSTYASDLAKKMNRDVQRVIDNPNYMEIFPETNLRSAASTSTEKRAYVRTTDMFEIVGREGSYKSVGVGGPLTGFGFDVGIIDDIVKGMKEAMSPHVSDTIWEWYQSVFFTRRREYGSKIIVMMTRWAEHDLIGRILEEAKLENVKAEVISFPMLFDDSLDYINPLDPRTENGEPLWENKFDAKFCESTKKSVGSKVWSSLYQQNPQPSGGAIFNRDWFKFYRELPEFDYTLLSLDATFKESQTSDYVVLGAWGIKGKNKYLLHVIRDRMNFNATLTSIYLMLAKFPKTTELVIEAKANGEAIISTLDQNPQIKVPIFGYSPTDSKEARAASIAPQVEAGHVFLPDIAYEKNSDKVWVADFLDEVIGFPNKKHDDQVDMFTQAMIRVNNSTMGWLEGIMEKDKRDIKNEHIDDHIRGLAEGMGWDIHNPSGGGFGLDF